MKNNIKEKFWAKEFIISSTVNENNIYLIFNVTKMKR